MYLWQSNYFYSKQLRLWLCILLTRKNVEKYYSEVILFLNNLNFAHTREIGIDINYVLGTFCIS